MIEIVGDIWTYPADARVVTTNGYIKKNGAGVMGRGVARQCMVRFPGIEFVLGRMVKDLGNTVHVIGAPPMTDVVVLSYPVKHNFWEIADLTLIRQSAEELVRFTTQFEFKVVVLPRPGCGNGQLEWDAVKPVIEPILDDRFHVIELPGRG